MAPASFEPGTSRPRVLRSAVAPMLRLTLYIPVVPSLAGLNCDSSSLVNEGFGEEFETADKAADSFDKNFAVAMQYKVEIGQEDLDLSTMDDIAKSIAMDFQKRQDTFNFIMDFVQRMLAFVFVRVFLRWAILLTPIG